MKERNLVIAFVDLSRFAIDAQTRTNREIASMLETFYELVGDRIGNSGRIVKFIGDAALIVFEEAAIEGAVKKLRALKESTDSLMQERGWQCRLNVKVHLGAVMTGEFGARGGKRFDVIGTAVNDAARLKGEGVVLSDAVAERLRAR